QIQILKNSIGSIKIMMNEEMNYDQFHELQMANDQLKNANDEYVEIIDRMSNELASYEAIDDVGEIFYLRKRNDIMERVVESQHNHIDMLITDNKTMKKSLRSPPTRKCSLNMSKLTLRTINVGYKIWEQLTKM
ncbi:hypothetical protein SNEBB_008563, partial [Seison nebaliae]